MNFTNLLATLFIFCCAILPVGCKEGPAANSGPQPLKLIATTGQINAALQKITAGVESVETQLFCGPGVDPHSFSASTSDVQAMLDADGIFYNGFHLEAKLAEHLDDTFSDKAWAMASAFPKAERLDWVEDGEVDPEAPFDPHIWNHLSAWAVCVEGLTDQLIKLDPANEDTYRKNSSAYIKEILETNDWAAKQLQSIPPEVRFIVSAHDAFNYFAKAYDMKTIAVLGIGNDPEADIKTMQNVANQVCENKIPAIFMESITNPKVTQALQEACASRDWSVKIIDQPLYSDDLGDSAPQNTFLGAFRSNVELICESLTK